MFSQVRERAEPTPATPELLAALARLAEPGGDDEEAPAAEPEYEPEPEPVAEAAPPHPATSPTASSSNC